MPAQSILDVETLDFIMQLWPQSPTGSVYLQSFDAAISAQTVVILGNVFARNVAHWLEVMLKGAQFEALGLA